MFNFLKRNRRHKDLKHTQTFLRGHLNQFLEIEGKVSPDVFDVTKFFFEEVLDIYSSMEILIKNSHFRSCVILARSILENSINLQYIYKQDTEQRAKDFKLASIGQLSKRFNNLEEKDGLFPYEEMKKVFDEMLKDTPQRISIAKKFEEIGMGSLHKDAYTRLSGYVHSEYKQTRDLEEERPYNQYLKRLVFSDISLVTLEALKSVCEKYDLDGGVMFLIDEPGYKGDIIFATNPKKQEEKESKTPTEVR